jgi:predicted Zn-ribbon and HTH transcriptional regulator
MAPYYNPVKGNKLVVCFCGHVFRVDKYNSKAFCPKCGQKNKE